MWVHLAALLMFRFGTVGAILVGDTIFLCFVLSYPPVPWLGAPRSVISTLRADRAKYANNAYHRARLVCLACEASVLLPLGHQEGDRGGR